MSGKSKYNKNRKNEREIYKATTTKKNVKHVELLEIQQEFQNKA